MVYRQLSEALAKWLIDVISYARFHIAITRQFTRTAHHVVWPVVKHLAQFAYALLSLSASTLSFILSFGTYILTFGTHIIWIVLLVITISIAKSLKPRYRFLASEKQRLAWEQGKLLKRANRLNAETKSVITENYDDLTQGAKFTELLKNATERVLVLSRRVNEKCSSSVTDGNIQSIHKSLPWSSTRFEFESVYWFNHTLQTLWPCLKTLTDKALIELKKQALCTNQACRQNKEKAAEKSIIETGKRRNIKSMLMKERDIQRKQAKMSIYLSCRRHLEQLRNKKELVLKKGDEYLGQKAVAIVVYLAKKFLLCSKQYFIDQFLWLASVFSESKADECHASDGRRIIELDLKEILRRQNIRFKLDQRKVKSAPEPSKNRKSAQVRFTSAPEFGLSQNSRRIVNSKSSFLRIDQLKKLKAKRQRLARSVNQILIRRKQANKTRDKSSAIDKKQAPILVERLDLGDSAPKITSIKFLEQDDHLLLADTLNRNAQASTSDANNMRLIVELSYASDNKFNIKLSSVPLLGTIYLTRLEWRFRLLVSVNHKDFSDHKNLDILDAADSEQLLPILNHVQVSLVDMPRVDWRFEGADRTRSESRKRIPPMQSSPEQSLLKTLCQTPRKLLKRNLQPLRMINHPYFKYMIHGAIFYLQRWFQPFDIRVGQLVYLKTLQ